MYQADSYGKSPVHTHFAHRLNEAIEPTAAKRISNTVQKFQTFVCDLMKGSSACHKTRTALYQILKSEIDSKVEKMKLHHSQEHKNLFTTAKNVMMTYMKEKILRNK